MQFVFRFVFKQRAADCNFFFDFFAQIAYAHGNLYQRLCIACFNISSQSFAAYCQIYHIVIAFIGKYCVDNVVTDALVHQKVTQALFEEFHNLRHQFAGFFRFDVQKIQSTGDNFSQ